jgi:hypothetical protein
MAKINTVFNVLPFKRNKTSLLLILVSLLTCVEGNGQSYNLQQLLKEGKLVSTHPVTPLTDSGKPGVSSKGVSWLKGVNFSTGTIEIDLRGKDIVQQSFLGIAFHGVDTITYDAIYFRPFNFQASDPVRKIHAVQYVSEPDFPWHRLREEKNGIYEKEIDPAPSPIEWFHARIVIEDTTIKVYVNQELSPSLTVNKLNTRKDGWIGLWSFGVNGEFANMVISK